MKMQSFFSILTFLMIMFVGIGTVSAYQMSHWKFDEGSGSTASDPSGGNDGTLTGAPGPIWTTGKIGPYALDFDGVDDWVDIGDLHVDYLTFSSWFKPNDPLFR